MRYPAALLLCVNHALLSYAGVAPRSTLEQLEYSASRRARNAATTVTKCWKMDGSADSCPSHENAGCELGYKFRDANVTLHAAGCTSQLTRTKCVLDKDNSYAVFCTCTSDMCNRPDSAQEQFPAEALKTLRENNPEVKRLLPDPETTTEGLGANKETTTITAEGMNWALIGPVIGFGGLLAIIGFIVCCCCWCTSDRRRRRVEAASEYGGAAAAKAARDMSGPDTLPSSAPTSRHVSKTEPDS